MNRVWKVIIVWVSPILIVLFIILLIFNLITENFFFIIFVSFYVRELSHDLSMKNILSFWENKWEWSEILIWEFVKSILTITDICVLFRWFNFLLLLKFNYIIQISSNFILYWLNTYFKSSWHWRWFSGYWWTHVIYQKHSFNPEFAWCHNPNTIVGHLALVMSWYIVKFTDLEKWCRDVAFTAYRLLINFVCMFLKPNQPKNVWLTLILLRLVSRHK